MTTIHLENFKAGQYMKGDLYDYFLPNNVDATWAWKDMEINSMLETASRKLGELNSFNSFSHLGPSIDLFILIYSRNEAVTSSRIEGTQTDLDEALRPKEDVPPKRYDDWQEVQNYNKALNEAIASLPHLPISSRLIKSAHKTLLQDNVRGENKLPGEYRHSPNWIGGTNINNAYFIPPHDKHVEQLMGDLEKFLHRDNQIPELIRIGIAHYQFETIHPFLDGNGRIGRLLIPLYLVSKKIIEKPLYISSYFERTKTQYYDYLTQVRTDNNMLQWLKYFLTGVEQSATQAINIISGILELREAARQKIYESFGRRIPNGLKLLDCLFTNPMIDVADVAKECSLQYQPANQLVDKMVEAGFLQEITGKGRNRMFLFRSSLDIFKNN